MTLPLIAPIGSNFVSDWPAQNAINCDLFDAAAGPCLTTNPLGTYTPVWTASVTNPSLGANAKQTGYYYLVFDMVYVYGEVRLGTGSSKGSGVYSVSLPFKTKSLVAGIGYPVIGGAHAHKSADSTQRQPLETIWNGPNIAMFGVRMEAGITNRRVTDLIPFTFGDGDGITWSARYQRDMT